jgi:hypothetical protein
MSWEDELDEINKEEANPGKNKATKKVFSKYEDEETEEITTTKKVKQETIRQKDKPIDYEKKYQERKKADIDMEKEIEESIKYIEDPELRLKKKLELMELRRAEKFLGEEKKELKEINLDFPLKVEKDYIDLATKSAAKINDVGRGPKYTLEFLKNSILELLPTLDEDSMENFIKTVKILSTKKNKDKGGKNKKNKNEDLKETKAVPKSDRFEERKGLYKQYGDGDIQGPPAEDDYNDDGDFM